MTDVIRLSSAIYKARKEIQVAHQQPSKYTEDMQHTANAIDALGVQHYAQSGEDLPERIVEKQATAIADLTYTYAELAYEADDDELTFYDDSAREKFEEHLEAGHDAAVGAANAVKSEDTQ